MKTLISLSLMSLVTVSSALATAQFPDRIVYEDKIYSLHTNPLEAYFAKHPKLRPTGGSASTALWRGYVATFEFKSDSLVLMDIEIQIMTKGDDGEPEFHWRSTKDELLPGSEVLLIDWFTGILVLPYGDLVDYVHMGYGSTYSNYILLEIRQGKLTGKRALDHRQYEEFKDKQFQAFKKTEEYKEHVASLKEDGDSEEFIDAFLRLYITNYTSRFLDEEELPSGPDSRGGE